MNLIFSNPGTLDFRALTMLGVNAKPNSTSPIGYFGTGLKYAVAVCARMGVGFYIQPGDGTTWRAQRKDIDFRGKQFSGVEVVCTTSHKSVMELPFTTELGKNWGLKHVYRELRSNCADEGGRIIIDNLLPPPKNGEVCFIVDSAVLCEYHRNRADEMFFNDPQADRFENHFRSTLHPGIIYYRGIAVARIEKPTKYSYNIMSQLTLTEDRTLSAGEISSVDYCIVTDADKNAQLASDLLTAPVESYEESLPMYIYVYSDPTIIGALNQTAHKLFAEDRSVLVPDIVEKLTRAYQKSAGYEPLPLSEKEDGWTKLAISTCQKELGFDFGNMSLIFNAQLPTGMLGLANTKDRRIYIGTGAFLQGYRKVLSTLIEEYFHVKFNVMDYSRKFQDLALDHLAKVLDK